MHYSLSIFCIQKINYFFNLARNTSIMAGNIETTMIIMISIFKFF